MSTELKSVANPGGGRKGNKAPRKRDRIQTREQESQLVQMHPHLQPRSAAVGPLKIQNARGLSVLCLIGPVDDKRLFVVKEKGRARNADPVVCTFDKEESVVVRHLENISFPDRNGEVRNKLDSVHYHSPASKTNAERGKDLLLFPEPNACITVEVLDALKSLAAKW